MAPNGPLQLREQDYLPLADCAFQHWGEREGEPFTHLRPLTPDASERAWQRTSAMTARQWAESAADDAVLDLQILDEWNPESVRDWLLSQIADRDQAIVVCYQPRVAIRVPWGVACDHWLHFFWTSGCAFPLSEEWVMVHDGDRFAVGRRA
jgi:hypothetical protein